MNTPLEQLIKGEISKNGFLSLERYMALCLAHPSYGYYTSQIPFGKEGDFITAPEISQLFGEMLAVWAFLFWSSLKEPSPFLYIECGPGRGSLIADFLRLSRSFPQFYNALEIHLVETSLSLREIQKTQLEDKPVFFHDHLSSVPQGAFCLIANEFFDALPIQQWVFTERKWRKRGVILENNHLNWGLGNDLFQHSTRPTWVQNTRAKEGNILETSPARLAYAQSVAERLLRVPGAALLIDYGYFPSQFGDTFQAIQAHRFCDPLKTPGKADLTAHVDFAALLEVFANHGVQTFPLLMQGAFLTRLGIHERAQKIAQNATEKQQELLFSGKNRLVSPQGMGNLFKVLGVCSPNVPTLFPF